MGQFRQVPVARESQNATRASSPEESPELEALFKALADSTRRRILRLLDRRSRTVNEVVRHFHLTQPSISRHLAILRNVGLVRDERRGRHIVYRLGDRRRLDDALRFLQAFNRGREEDESRGTPEPR